MWTWFNTGKYVDAQLEEFLRRMKWKENCSFIEFWWKPFWDYHAARVLPWYDSHCKWIIIKELVESIGATVTFVVNALDILDSPIGRKPHWRIRWDTGLYYNEETLRMCREAREIGIPVESVTISCNPSWEREEIEKLKEDLEIEGIKTIVHSLLPGYWNPKIKHICRELDKNEQVHESWKSLITISPGWWSGKFGVLLSEMRKALQEWKNPNFIKFETFPVFSLPPTHPLNMAFMAATADLWNVVLEVWDGMSWYDKDESNLGLLKELFWEYWKSEEIKKFDASTDMWVNMIHIWIEDEEVITDACKREIERRWQRYGEELKRGEETPSTLTRMGKIKEDFMKIYWG